MVKLPKITLVTPSLNQSKFIERTIKSVLSQNYPNLEYIVMDGGSTDSTIDLLKKYSNKITWISEKDKGQSHAINKGLKKAKGEIVGYLNSDDYLENDCLYRVGEYFAKNKDMFWLTGKCRIVNETGEDIERFITVYKNIFLKYARYRNICLINQFISQPATFWRKRITSEVGYFDEKLQYSMDYDYWLRIWKIHNLGFLDQYLAAYRIHSVSKSYISPEKLFQEAYNVVQFHSSSIIILFLHRIHNLISLLIYRLIRSHE